MLDIKRIRENPQSIIQALVKRGINVDFTEVLEWDQQHRDLQNQYESLRSEQKKVSKVGITDYSSLRALAQQVKDLHQEIDVLENKIIEFLITLPNIPADDVIAGGKENNQVIQIFGSQTLFNFKPKDHIELMTGLKLIDYDRGTKLSGNGYWIYTGDGAVLEWALLNYFISEHLKDGYEFVLPPHILNYQCGYSAGQFPRFEDDVFHLSTFRGGKECTGQFLLPTAETALINLHRDEILREEDLPKKYFAYTPCYRRESGNYGSKERGMIRGHQFNKVEMFQYSLPEYSEIAFDELVLKACKLVEGLGLHYRVVQLAAEDCSASMAKTYDIEVWIPNMNEYKEVSSISNACDYQARRANIRVKRQDVKHTEYLHTLNASGLATSRVLPALIEQFQQEDGSILIPKVLQPFVGKEVLKI